MRKISKPPQASGAVFLQCVSGVATPDLKRRLTSVKTDIETAAAAYELAAANGNLHMLPVSVGVAGTVTKEEMSALYTVKMAKANSPGRPVYDKLMLLAPRGVCPLCGVNKASTLDHHLPKALFSPLAVAPTNLIPACRDCNITKRTSRPTTAGDQTFHPYFDDFGTDRWLYADVVESSPPAVRFFVQPPLVGLKFKQSARSLTLTPSRSG
ncbi:HNH endonuclease [Cystobacter fuscus]